MSDKVKHADADVNDASTEASELSEHELEQAVGGGGNVVVPWTPREPSQWDVSLRVPRINPNPNTPVINVPVLRPGRGPLEDGGFKLTIPGPSFVQVQSAEERDAAALEDTTATAASASEIYQDLLEE